MWYINNAIAEKEIVKQYNLNDFGHFGDPVSASREMGRGATDCQANEQGNEFKQDKIEL